MYDRKYAARKLLDFKYMIERCILDLQFQSANDSFFKPEFLLPQNVEIAGRTLMALCDACYDVQPILATVSLCIHHPLEWMWSWLYPQQGILLKNNNTPIAVKPNTKIQLTISTKSSLPVIAVLIQNNGETIQHYNYPFPTITVESSTKYLLMLTNNVEVLLL